jgi:hypothetical protein
MVNPTNNPDNTAAITRRYVTRSGKAFRRQSFIDAEVTSEQVQRYLFKTNNYERGAMDSHLLVVLPVSTSQLGNL